MNKNYTKIIELQNEFSKKVITHDYQNNNNIRGFVGTRTPAFALKARLDNPEQRLNDPELLAALQATTKATRMGRRQG